MRIAHIGHAGFIVEGRFGPVVMDPWLSPEGAYDLAWFQNPINHHLAGRVLDALDHPDATLYISHEHADHMDRWFLRQVRRDVRVVIPAFRSMSMMRWFSDAGFTRVERLADGESLGIPGGFITLYLDDAVDYHDSGAVLELDEQVFANINDARLYDRADEMRRLHGHVEAFTAQFSGASWHPVCYEQYSRQQKREICADKFNRRWAALDDMIDALDAPNYIPSAGPCQFLDPSIPYLPEAFPSLDAYKAVSRFARRFAEQPFALAPAALLAQAVVRVARREEAPPAGWEALDAKLQAFHDAGGEFPWSIWFSSADAIYGSGPLKYTVRGNVNDALGGAMRWDDLFLSMRLKLRREPDVYDPFLKAWLTGEFEDMQDLAEQQRAAKTRETGRTVVTDTSGQCWEVDATCPHAGGDIDQSCVKGGLVICKRHGYVFDLLDGGRTTNGHTINARRVP